MKAPFLAVAISAALLSACGGGGGGGDKNDATPSGVVVSTSSFPVAAAVSAMLQTSGSFTVTAVDASGKTDTLTVTTAPGTQATFENNVASTAVQTVLFKQNGVLTDQSVTKGFFQVTPYLAFGSVDQSTGEYTVADIGAPLYLPASAKVGDTGPLNTSITYRDSSKTTIVGRDTNTWSLEADTATTAYLCSNTVHTPASGTAYSESDCDRITTSGVVTGHTVTINQNGQSLTFK
jgi:hypothetical protein